MAADSEQTVVAVTGTDGKTSTVEFTRQLLAHAGHAAASWGTLGLVTERGRVSDPPMAVGPDALPAFLAELHRDGVEVATLEAFSSTLARGLLDSVTADVAAITTLHRDHLDFHGSFDAYVRAKARLFETVLAPDGTAVLNADVSRLDDFRDGCRERGQTVLVYGRATTADVRLVAASPTPAGTRLRLAVAGHDATVETGVVGDMMLENVLCAVAASVAVGVPPARAVEGVSTLDPPVGRVERVADHDGAAIYVDYAHTPGALRAVLDALRLRADGRLLVAFGCGGGTDPGKRRRMGRIAAELADVVFVTDDNPRREDPAAIRRAILGGCPGASEVSDRRRAIERAVGELTTGDVLVVAGKGHETTQTVGREARQFSDHAVVREATGHVSR